MTDSEIYSLVDYYISNPPKLVVIAIDRVRNPKINFYKSTPLPLWDVHGSIPLLDPP